MEGGLLSVAPKLLISIFFDLTCPGLIYPKSERSKDTGCNLNEFGANFIANPLNYADGV